MKYLMSLIVLLSFLTSAQAQPRFNPNAEEPVIGTVCKVTKADAQKLDKNRTPVWTKYLLGHVGEKCWHLKGDTTPIRIVIAQINAKYEQKLFNEFMSWLNSREKAP